LELLVILDEGTEAAEAAAEAATAEVAAAGSFFAFKYTISTQKTKTICNPCCYKMKVRNT
jgi:hypothetical protein